MQNVSSLSVLILSSALMTVTQCFLKFWFVFIILCERNKIIVLQLSFLCVISSISIEHLFSAAYVFTSIGHTVITVEPRLT